MTTQTNALLNQIKQGRSGRSGITAPSVQAFGESPTATTIPQYLGAINPTFATPAALGIQFMRDARGQEYLRALQDANQLAAGSAAQVAQIEGQADLAKAIISNLPYLGHAPQTVSNIGGANVNLPELQQNREALRAGQAADISSKADKFQGFAPIINALLTDAGLPATTPQVPATVQSATPFTATTDTETGMGGSVKLQAKAPSMEQAVQAVGTPIPGQPNPTAANVAEMQLKQGATQEPPSALAGTPGDDALQQMIDTANTSPLNTQVVTTKRKDGRDVFVQIDRDNHTMTIIDAQTGAIEGPYPLQQGLQQLEATASYKVIAGQITQ